MFNKNISTAFSLCGLALSHWRTFSSVLTPTCEGMVPILYWYRDNIIGLSFTKFISWSIHICLWTKWFMLKWVLLINHNFLELQNFPKKCKNGSEKPTLTKGQVHLNYVLKQFHIKTISHLLNWRINSHKSSFWACVMFSHVLSFYWKHLYRHWSWL